MSFLDLHLSIASLVRRVVSLRFLKFGIVGSSGLAVNEGVLFLMHAYVFHVNADSVDWMRLNLSLAVAIFFATLNNFFWNRLWTWADRKHHYPRPWLSQFGQYALACWFSIVLQFLLTNLLAPYLHNVYVANLIAIALTSVLNFLLNDIWTFGRLKLLRSQPDAPGSRDHA